MLERIQELGTLDRRLKSLMVSLQEIQCQDQANHFASCHSDSIAPSNSQANEGIVACDTSNQPPYQMNLMPLINTAASIKPKDAVLHKEARLRFNAHNSGLIACTPWSQNSCWLDSGLEAIYWTIRPVMHTIDWKPTLDRVDNRSLMVKLIGYLQNRLKLKPSIGISLQLRMCLGQARDDLRSSFVGSVITNTNSFHSSSVGSLYLITNG